MARTTRIPRGVWPLLLALGERGVFTSIGGSGIPEVKYQVYCWEEGMGGFLRRLCKTDAELVEYLECYLGTCDYGIQESA